MKKTVVLLCTASAMAILAANLLAQSAAAPAGIKTEIVGLSVIKDIPTKTSSGMTMHTPGAGTAVSVRITNPNVTFLSLDEDAGKVQTFTDDKGTSLTKAGAFGAFQSNSFSVVSKDGHTLSFKITSDDIPAKGAKTITLKATAAAVVGVDKQETTVKGVSLAKGTAVKLGAVAAKITKAGKPTWGSDKDKLEVTFQASQSFMGIKSIAFIGPDGKEIKSHRSSSSQFGSTYEVTYDLAAAAKTVDIKLSYFAKTQKVSLPVVATVGVGL